MKHINEINENNFNRLTIAIIEKYKCDYGRALEILNSLKLCVICGEKINISYSLQAALLTAVNTGKRAFLGGVYVVMTENINSLIFWPKKPLLNEVVKELEGKVMSTVPKCDFYLFLGKRPDIYENSLELICNGWQGGVVLPTDNIELENKNDFALGGIASASLAVCLSFLKVSGLYIMSCDKSVGISLWRPDLNWLELDAYGPELNYLPKRIWLLGLGHLGQAYIWNLGLLLNEKSYKMEILLQDYDKIIDANWFSSILSDAYSTGIFKTRISSKWLTTRGINTRITERKFNENTIREGEEPYVALCGFDSAGSRKFLENAGFDLVVECGLGGEMSNFDYLSMHTFPRATQTPNDIWSNPIYQQKIFHGNVHKSLQNIEDCGIIANSIAEKSISSSFVGCFAGSIVIGELLRSLHSGIRYEKLSLKLRDLENKNVTILKNYVTEASKNGFIKITK